MEEISSLPISPAHRAKLLSAGYSTFASLAVLSPSHLARELNIAPHEAWKILKFASESSKSERSDGSHAIFGGAQTAWDMLSEEQNLKHISTGCEDLDKILGGGIHCKEVTEVDGVPGIGKTQLGIQLAVDVQIPVDYGGLGGKAIYIDTEGSFMVERAYQIAEACISDTLDRFVPHWKNLQGFHDRMHPNNFLSNIFYFRICSYTEQIAVLNYLDKFLAEQKDVILGHMRARIELFFTGAEMSVTHTSTSHRLYDQPQHLFSVTSKGIRNTAATGGGADAAATHDNKRVRMT